MIKERKNIILNISNGAASRMSEKYIKNNHTITYNKINNHFSSLNINKKVLFKEKIWLWVNDKNDLPKCHCGKYTKINSSWIKGYRRNCSVKCMQNDNIHKENLKKSLKEKKESGYFKSKEYQDKLKSTNLKKWGVDHYSKTDEFKEKIKKTNLENWGVDHYSKTDEYKERVKKTSQDNWNVDNYAKTDESKLKYKETCLNKWGVENYAKTDEYKEKIKQTNLENWGVEFYMQSDEFKEKSKETLLSKYNVDHYSKTDEFKEKIKKTNLENWGFVSHTMNEDHRKHNYKISNNPFYLNYMGNTNNLFKCDCDSEHTFEILTTTYYSRKNNNLPLCTKCYPLNLTPSFKELELKEFIQSIYDGQIISSYKDELEIDIYLPELNIGFEYNGIYWHSDKFLNKNYHVNKTEFFKNKGIRIIHIWEDDWINKSQIIKSQIKNWLNITPNKIWARKCEIKEIKEVKIAKDFLNTNHIQGFVNSSLKLGLFYNNELVSIMSFDNLEGRKRMQSGELNLNRFCNKLNTTVVGGASKLFNHLIKNYNIKRVISYADKDWSSGNIYYKLGFKKVSESKPDYKYLVDKERKHKSNFTKAKLKLKEHISEYEYMKLNNIYKIWDCGKIKFEHKK